MADMCFPRIRGDDPSIYSQKTTGLVPVVIDECGVLRIELPPPPTLRLRWEIAWLVPFKNEVGSTSGLHLDRFNDSISCVISKQKTQQCNAG